MERKDSEVMQAICAGDEEAFIQTVDRYKDSLVNYLTHMVRSRERAEDIAQEAFVRFYRTAARYRDIERIGPHLFRIATNFTISEMRRQRRWTLLMPRLRAATEQYAPPADAGVLSSEVQQKVLAALETLPAKFRAPLVLYEIEEWSYDDIARSLDCRIGTVKSRISRARELMRLRLAGWWIGGQHGRNQDSARQSAPRERVASLHL
jgi:RNA polymerase sigma-70 factor (ECF subfamily)